MEARLILMRHGQSVWNLANLFTGWVDVPLSPKGIEEALNAGEIIRDFPIDVIFTSTLVRAQQTLFLAMSKHSSKKTLVVLHDENTQLGKWGALDPSFLEKEVIPVTCHDELNERMYGELQGLNKDEMRKRFGPEMVQTWRRSYDTEPPGGESLKMTAARTYPFFEKSILPTLKKRKNVLVSAHGNSLRAIIMKLDDLSEEEIVGLEIPTGKPLVYEYRQGKLTKDETHSIS